MRRNKIFFTVLLATALLAACSKYKLGDKQWPAWEGEWLLPLLKGTFNFEDIRTLSQTKTTYNVPAMDIGFTEGITVDVPVLDIPEVGPYKQPLSPWIESVNFDSLRITLSFDNLFPIAIDAGTHFSFRKSEGTGSGANLIYEHIVDTRIEPGARYTFDVVVQQNTVEDTLYIYLEQFKSPGGDDVVFATTPCVLQVETKVIDLKQVGIYSGKSLVETDTLGIEWGADDLEFEDTVSTARIHCYFENALPVNQYLQIYFLDPLTAQPVDSLLNQSLNIQGCQTDALGVPVNTTQATTSVDLSVNRVRKIRKTQRAVFYYQLNTLGYSQPVIRAGEQTYFNIQLTGDLKLHFKLQ